MKTAALILAAGVTTSEDGFEPLRKVGSISAVQRLIHTFRRAGAEPVVLVAGTDRDKLQKHVSRLGAVVLENPDSAAEMFHNVVIGLNYLDGQCDQVLVTPVDIPLFSVETVTALMESGQVLANPVHDGRRGHPLLIGEKLIPAILAYDGPDGLRGAVRACGVPRALVEVSDPGVLLDVDRGRELEAQLVDHTMARLRPVVKLRIAKDEVFFGPGTSELLQRIEATSSVRLACQEMGMSYSKGWKLLSLMEEQLGYTVVARQQGGKAGGKACLTDRGRDMLLRYRQFEKEARDAVEAVFHRHF